MILYGIIDIVLRGGERHLSPTELRRLPRVALLARRSVEDSACRHPAAGGMPEPEAFRPSVNRPGSFSSSLGWGFRIGGQRYCSEVDKGMLL